MMLALIAQVALAAAAPPIHVRAGESATVTAPGDDLRWFVARPIAADYDNVAACGARRAAGCHATLRYERIDLPELDGRTTIDVADVPALAAPGTHRLGFAAAGAWPVLDEATVAGLREIVVRRDDTYVGYLTELLGVPFVLVPARVGGVHQTDARLGADCVALVIYGRRRLGAPVEYMAPRALRRWLVPAGTARAGDVLHFGWQTAVLYEDRGTRGVVDENDLIIHTFHRVAEIARLGDVPYGRARHELLRWGR